MQVYDYENISCNISHKGKRLQHQREFDHKFPLEQYKTACLSIWQKGFGTSCGTTYIYTEDDSKP